MKPIPITGLPEGAKVYGVIYEAPYSGYRCGHIVDIHMHNGARASIIWDGLDHDTPFAIEGRGHHGGSSGTWTKDPIKAVEWAVEEANRYGRF